jgi:HK97 family phage prohead protease
MKLQAAINGYDRHSRTFWVVASTPNPTRAYNEKGEPFLESLVGWDLARFEKNPIIAWGHDTFSLPIGKATAWEEMPDGGLRVQIQLRSAGRSELVDEIAGALEDDILRAVSVGFTPGESKQNPDGSWTRTNNELHELSLVSVPADENAGNEALNPEAEPEGEDEKQRKRVSAAAAELAKARARLRGKKASLTRTDAEEMRLDVMRLDTSRLSKAERTSIGGFRIPARLTRTGVLVYRNPDGTERRELRLPDEVFKADSLATLKDVPVIDIKDHTGLVTPDTWKKSALGHIPEARRDGDYVAADVVVQDAATIAAVERGDRIDISCGYGCRIERTSGVYKGERFDCIQRDIRYNHAALCPPNRGRAGPEVGLRLDTNGGHAWSVSQPNEEAMTIKIRLDGKDYEVGSQDHLDKLDEMHKAALAQAEADAKTKLDAKDAEIATLKTSAQKTADELQGKLDAAEARAKKSEEELEKAKKEFEEEDEEEEKSKRSRALRLIRNLVRALRIKGLRMTEETEKKLDADVEKWVEMGDGAERAIMLDAIRADGTTFDDTDKSDDYVRARFDSTFDAAKDKRGVHGTTREFIREQSRTENRNDVSDDDPVIANQKKHAEWTKTAHQSK